MGIYLSIFYINKHKIIAENVVNHPDIHSGNICPGYSFPKNINTALKQTIGDSAVIIL